MHYYNILKENARYVWSFFLDLIFPIECFSCGQEGNWLCQDCFKEINLLKKQYCLNCKRENNFGEFCLNCRSNFVLDGVWIASSYEEEIIAKLIKSLKYYFIKAIGEELGKLLIIFLNNLINQVRINKFDLLSGLDWCKFDRVKKLPLIILNFKENLVMAVPLSKRRQRFRGFNQAEVLARVVAEYFNLNIDFNNLIRVKHKKAQAKLSERQRKENIINCFGWQGNHLSGQNIILVDDVVTTGSTLNECAKILKKNGAGQVWGLVVAKG